MKPNLNNILLDAYIRDINQARKQYFTQKKFTKKKGKEIKRYCLSVLNSESNYKNFELKGHDVTKMVIAVCDTHFGEKIIMCNTFIFAKGVSAESVKHEIKQIKSFDSTKKLPLFISVLASDLPMLKIMESLGYNPWSYNLVGKVDDVLSRLKVPDNSPEFIVIIPSKRSISELVQGEKAAHQSEATSCVGKWSKKKEAECIKHYRQWLKAKMVVAVKSKNKIIGALAVMGVGSNGHIGTIWVHPKFQGNGISKMLYQAGLQKMKEKKYVDFTGHTSTTKVLNYAKKINRKIFLYNFKI